MIILGEEGFIIREYGTTNLKNIGNPMEGAYEKLLDMYMDMQKNRIEFEKLNSKEE